MIKDTPCKQYSGENWDAAARQNTLLSDKCYERRRTLDTDEKFTLSRKQKSYKHICKEQQSRSKIYEVNTDTTKGRKKQLHDNTLRFQHPTFSNEQNNETEDLNYTRNQTDPTSIQNTLSDNSRMHIFLNELSLGYKNVNKKAEIIQSIFTNKTECNQNNRRKTRKFTNSAN